MKKITALLATVLITCMSYAQQILPAFGSVSKTELEEKKSPQDDKAEAEVIFDLADIELIFYDGGLEVVMKKHERIKIYNEKGLEEANIKIPYLSRNGMEIVTKLEAQTYNLDNSGNIKITKLEKQAVYNKKVNNRISNQVFTFPEAKAGSILEYKYILKRKVAYFSDWYFQKNIPVRYSRCTLDYPEEFMFNPVFQTSLPYGYDVQKKGLRSIQKLDMKNVPAFRDEPYMSCDADYLQKVIFRLNGYFSPTVRINLVATWPNIIKDLMEDEDFGLQLKKNIPRTKELDEQLKLISNPEEKMITVHRFVKKNMEWDEYTSIWALDGVKHAWDKKKGNSGEINLILVNLLKDAGLQAYPVLLSTRENGRINTANPDIDQFNTVMAYVKIGEKEYYLDGTDQQTPSHIIPQRIHYSEGLVISKVDFEKSFNQQDWGWVTIWDPVHRYTHRVNLSGEIKPDGQVSGEALINSMDYARLSDIRDYKEGKEKFVEEHYTKTYQGMNLLDFKAGNLEKDSLPMEQSLKFSMPLNASGEYQYFTLNMFTGLDKNIFLSDERASDIFFGYNQLYTVAGSFKIPEGYAFEELPKNLKLIMPDTSIIMSRLLQVENDRIQFRITLEFNTPVITVQDYPMFREFYKKMYATLNEQIVIKKAKP